VARRKHKYCMFMHRRGEVFWGDCASWFGEFVWREDFHRHDERIRFLQFDHVQVRVD